MTFEGNPVKQDEVVKTAVFHLKTTCLRIGVIPERRSQPLIRISNGLRLVEKYVSLIELEW